MEVAIAIVDPKPEASTPSLPLLHIRDGQLCIVCSTEGLRARAAACETKRAAAAAGERRGGGD